VTTRDDELLDVLATSLGPPPDAEPSWAEISQLHRVVDTAAGRGRDRRHGARVWRIRRPLTAAMAGFLVLGSAAAAAALSGAVMPQPVRVAARAVGLPVDSADLAGARAGLARLRDALDRRPPDLGAIRALAQDARDRVGRLSADDRSHVDAEATFLLGEADNALASPPAPLGAPPPEVRPASPSGAAPAPASPSAEPGDDHGRNQPTFDPNQSGHGSDDHPSGDERSGSSANPSGSGTSGQGSSGSSDGDHTATTQHVDNSGPGGSDGGPASSDGGSDGGGSGNGGGGHSGPG
jgi:uncharacterized membrane protein YgcG